MAPDPAVFLCISMLARAVGSQIEQEIRPILDQIFGLGLTLELTNALKVLAREIPALEKDIQGTYTYNEDDKSIVFMSIFLSIYRWSP